MLFCKGCISIALGLIKVTSTYFNRIINSGWTTTSKITIARKFGVASLRHNLDKSNNVTVKTFLLFSNKYILVMAKTEKVNVSHNCLWTLSSGNFQYMNLEVKTLAQIFHFQIFHYLTLDDWLSYKFWK